MSQKTVWENEYAQPRLMTLGFEPQADVLRFFKWLKKTYGNKIEEQKVLDLGCGTGRNSNYLAALGAKVTGLEIASNALAEAKRRALDLGVSIEYHEQNIGQRWPLQNEEMSLLLDVTSSNSLNEAERQTYLKEAVRVLMPSGMMFVRALCKDGDKNAKQLIKELPGRERDTYILKGVGLTERVFTENDFRKLYGEYFQIIKLEKRSGYQRFNNQSYKRNYWLAYLQKK